MSRCFVQQKRSKEDKAATSIQSLVRGRVGRKIYKRRMREYNEYKARREAASRAIQRVYRGYRGRKRAKEFRGLQSILRYSPRFPAALAALEIQIAPLTFEKLLKMDPQDVKPEDMEQILTTARVLEKMVRYSFQKNVFYSWYLDLTNDQQYLGSRCRESYKNSICMAGEKREG